MGRTKKVGIAGKYGSRYGVKSRRKLVALEERKTKICPHCNRKQLKRVAAGIFECNKCNNKFTGGAHIVSLKGA